ncbi:MAG: PadR family transcriptional regulator [Candidatus Aminicenantes bacterium]|nr:PadR family transcriptional regulator [Candidatus Aminicenantes bacterium]
MEYISRADEILLLAILKLDEDATGVTIIRHVRKSLGKKLSLGGLWVSLDILAKKGLVTKRLGDPTPRPGGRRKLYYRLTDEGLDALERTQALNRALWKEVPQPVKSGR